MTQTESNNNQTVSINSTGSETSTKHEATLYPEVIFTVGRLPITNSLISSWLAVFLIIIFSIFLQRNIKNVPGLIQNYAEVILEGALNLADSVTGSRILSLRFLPLVFPIFVFILVSNWLGLIPGFSAFGLINNGHFVPFLRGTTADLNTTLALAIIAVVATHIFGVVMTGAWSHLNRFVGFNLLLSLPKEIFVKRNYQALIVVPIKFFVGLLEIISEFAKVASLSFRLFGNVFAGEVLLGVMAAIFALVLPIPFLFFEVFVGLIQAVIFAMLVLVFLTVMATSHEEAH